MKVERPSPGREFCDADAALWSQRMDHNLAGSESGVKRFTSFISVVL